jgi:hypothetical protein
MSLTGISKVKSSSTITVGVQKRGMVKLSSSSSAYLNVDFTSSGSYSGDNSKSYHTSTKAINVENSLSNPSTGYVNLGFDFIHVESSLQRQTSSSIANDVTYLNVDNSLSYSYTKNVNTLFRINTKVLNVISDNSEYDITLNLDGTSLPEVNVFYPNVDERVEVELDEDVVWS